jgi:hypothetical protein
MVRRFGGLSFCAAPCARVVPRGGGSVVTGVVSVLFVVVVVVVVVVARLLATCASVSVGGGRLVCVVVCVRRRLRWSVDRSGRRLPSCPAWCGVVCSRGVGVDLQWNPGVRWMGQWCHGMGGWHVQHHVMAERMAPQLWQGSVAQRVGVVSLRVAWLFGALQRGHVR